MGEWKVFDPKDANNKLPQLNQGALYGVWGRVTRALTDHTEASQAAVLGCLLVLAGCFMNGMRYFKIAKDIHYPILFLKVIGKSAKGRKGFAKNLAVEFFKLIDPNVKKRMRTGITSGEGLVSMVSDVYEKKQKKGPGVDLVTRTEEEKIIVINESEGGRLFKVMERMGNTVSPVLRDLWDAQDVAVENKNSPIRSTRPLVSVFTNITIDELLKTMNAVEIANGYANRFLPALSQRTRIEPMGGEIDDNHLDVLAKEVSKMRLKSFEIAKTKPQFKFTEAAGKYWDSLYRHYAANELQGMLGSLTARTEPMIVRIAMIFAFYDGVEKIDEAHLIAANHVWKYAEDSWRFVYGDSLGDPIADELLKFLRSSKKERTKTAIINHFDNNKTAEEINKAIKILFEARLIEIKEVQDNGPKKFLYRARDLNQVTNLTNSTNAVVPEQPPNNEGNSSNSLNSSDAQSSQSIGNGAADVREGTLQ